MRLFTPVLIATIAVAQNYTSSSDTYTASATVNGTDGSGSVSRSYDTAHDINASTYSANIDQIFSSTISLVDALSTGDIVQTYACNGDSANQCFITEFSDTEVKYYFAEQPAAGWDASSELLA